MFVCGIMLDESAGQLSYRGRVMESSRSWPVRFLSARGEIKESMETF